jgi:hypothetical protein
VKKAPGARREAQVTQSALEAMCVRWQGKLRLLDWDVKIRFARHWEMSANRNGEVSWTVNSKTACISILDPRDYSTESKWPQDIEQVVVHELVHLHMAPFDDENGKKRNMLVEQAVDLLACALVNCDRE